MALLLCVVDHSEEMASVIFDAKSSHFNMKIENLRSERCCIMGK